MSGPPPPAPRFAPPFALVGPTASILAPPFALVGPTASGKTPIALAIAPALGAEIVCIDSMTLYRGMDIGTAKPTLAERTAVPHHLLDLCAPGDGFGVAAFQRRADAALADIDARGRRALLVGGSGLYFRAVVDAFAFPPADPVVRARLERTPVPVLAAMLRERDPEALTFLDATNKRRVVRALEVIEVTGRPFSSFRAEWDRRAPVVAAGIRVDAPVLAARIDARLIAMLETGFLAEVAALLESGHREAVTTSQAIAYREAVALLDGEIDRAEFLRAAGAATRRFARRQMSWFRRDPRITWFDGSEPEVATDEIAAYYGRSLTELRQRESDPCSL